MRVRLPPTINPTAGCTPQPDETCACGWSGPGYAFGTVNGKRSCVRCTGSAEQRGKMGNKTIAQQRGADKQKKKPPQGSPEAAK